MLQCIYEGTFSRAVKKQFDVSEKTGLPCPSVIYEGIFLEQVSKETKGETNAENEQETETRMVAVPEPPGTALLQQLVQAVHPQL